MIKPFMIKPNEYWYCQHGIKLTFGDLCEKCGVLGSMRPSKKRTLTQNKALHLYFQLIADRLNDAGLDMKKVLTNVDIPWSQNAVKEYLWRPIQQAQLQKTSTTELTTKDIDPVFETLNRHLAQFGVTEAFPSIAEIMLRGAVPPDYPQPNRFDN